MKKRRLEPMDENKYWKLIEDSLKEAAYKSHQEQFLVHELRKMSLEAIASHELRTDLLMDALYTSDLWCAAYLMNNGCSEDGFHYFRYWVISRGQKVYYDALQYPDSLLSQVDPNMKFYDFETYGYLAHNVFEQKTGQNLYAYLPKKLGYFERPKIVFTWKPEDPETVRSICPQLFDKMWRR